MADKSLLDLAFDVLSSKKGSVAFKDLFNKVIKLSGLDLSESELRSRISKFYSQLTLDGRFVVLTDNQWDLRTRHSYDEVHIDMEDAYSDDESEEDVDAEEQKYLNEELGEVSEEEDDNESDDIDFDKKKDADETGEEF